MAFQLISSAYADSDDEESEEENIAHEEAPDILNIPKRAASKSPVTSVSNTCIQQQSCHDDIYVNEVLIEDNNHDRSCKQIHPKIQSNQRDENRTQTNFFGIESDSDSDSASESPTNRSVLKFNQSHMMDPTVSATEPNAVVPNSAFWQKQDSPQLWDQPQKIWKPSHADISAQYKPTQHSKRHINTRDNNPVGYMSKRAKMSNPRLSENTNSQVAPITRKCFFVHHRVQPYLHKKNVCHMPPSNSKTLHGHTGLANRIHWNNFEYSHLLLSVSMDKTVKIWNAFSTITLHVQEFCHHNKAVKDGIWVNQGKQVLTCGYDNSARLFDVEKGTQMLEFPHKALTTCIKCHPSNPNYFMCGSLNRIICWDQRTNSRPVRSFAYKEPFGQVQDIQFINEGREFFICNDMVSRDSSDKNIMVWDFLAGVVLSNQVYHERYTCTRLKANPLGGEVLAQTNGDYIALFSTVRPYKMNKCKRFESHKVQGYSIGCDISPDGQYVISGSADKQLFVYDYRTSRVLRTLKCDDQVCVDVAWHPDIPGVVAASTWGGDIKVWS